MYNWTELYGFTNKVICTTNNEIDDYIVAAVKDYGKDNGLPICGRKLAINAKKIYEALEKQFPMEPEIQQDSNNNDCLECQRCGSFIGYKSDCYNDENYQVNYCQCCGQKIDWRKGGRNT